MQSEEDRMLLKQKENAAEQEERVIVGQGSATNRIPLVNGQGDGTGYSSALLQVLCGTRSIWKWCSGASLLHLLGDHLTFMLIN